MASLNVFTEREIKELESFAKVLDEFIANNQRLIAELERMRDDHSSMGWNDNGSGHSEHGRVEPR